MPRAPTILKTIDTLIILIFKDPHFDDEDIRIIVLKIREIVIIINEAFSRN